MTTLDDLRKEIADEDGLPYGQGYAFTVGSEAVNQFIVNLATTKAHDVSVIATSTRDKDAVLFNTTVPTFEEGVQEALIFLAEKPEEILESSDSIL